MNYIFWWIFDEQWLPPISLCGIHNIGTILFACTSYVLSHFVSCNHNLTTQEHYKFGEVTSVANDPVILFTLFPAYPGESPLSIIVITPLQISSNSCPWHDTSQSWLYLKPKPLATPSLIPAGKCHWTKTSNHTEGFHIIFIAMDVKQNSATWLHLLLIEMILSCSLNFHLSPVLRWKRTLIAHLLLSMCWVCALILSMPSGCIWANNYLHPGFLPFHLLKHFSPGGESPPTYIIHFSLSLG